MEQNRNKKLIAILFLAGIFFFQNISAQDKTVDQVVAVVGGNIILKSDVEEMYKMRVAEGYFTEGDMKCEILEDLLIEKLLIAEAELDTLITVSPSQINQQMDGQIQFYITRLGSEKAVEDYFKKTIAVIKSEMQDAIRNNLLSQQMKNKIVQDVTITPSEVRFNYRNLNPEEIPVIPAQYEYAQITIKPVIEIEEDNRVKAQLRELKERIENGANFATLAIMYSEEPGADRSGGELPFMGRGELDPAFAAAAFNLRPDRVSNVVESEYGYHIIQLMSKQGEKIKTRHILMRPKVSIEAREQAISRLDSLANILRKNEISFSDAAMMFSTDKNSRNNGGIAVNPNTMSSKFTVEELGSNESKILTKMNINEISNSFETIDEESQQTVYKIVKLINKTEQHKANLQEDYQQLANMNLIKKKEEVLSKWVSDRQAQTYIRIDNTYSNCNFRFGKWIK
jgi:peptidyl-prolyl cis-trans isomerase SurA